MQINVGSGKRNLVIVLASNLVGLECPPFSSSSAKPFPPSVKINRLNRLLQQQIGVGGECLTTGVVTMLARTIVGENVRLSAGLIPKFSLPNFK